MPINATTSQTYARLRWSTQSGLSFDGAAPDGEVEDHPLTITLNTGASCPAGFVLFAQPGNASAVIVDASGGSLALGPEEPAGTTATTANSARLSNSANTLVLDLGALVAQNESLQVMSARDTNSGNVTVSASADNVSFTTLTTLSGGSTDVLQATPVTIPSGGARYVRFQQNSGRYWIAGMSYGEICLPLAVLNGAKTATIYDPLSEGLFAIPGNDVIYTITITNSGDGVADTDSVSLVDELPADIEFYNAPTPEFGNAIVGWSDSSSTLSFNPVTDLGFSDSTTKPTSFADCTYTPASGYDPDIRFVCFNPKGSFAAGTPVPSFSISFRGRIR